MTTLLASLRARLGLLMLASALPAMVALLYLAFWLRDHSLADYRKQVQTEAARLAAHHTAQIEETRLLLTALAHVPEIRAGQGDRCAGLLSDIKAQAPAFIDNLLVAQASGDILCSAVPTVRVINVADMAWFRDGLASSDFRVGEYHISRHTGAPLANATLRLDEPGHPGRVLAAGINLDGFAAMVNLGRLPAGAAYAVFDRAGNRLIRYPKAALASPHNISATPFWQALRGLKNASAFQADAPEGEPRLFAYAPLGPAERPYARLVVGVPARLIDLESTRTLGWVLATLTLSTLLGLVLGAFGAWHLVARPLRPLLDAVTRMAAGDLSARVHGRPGFSEADRLADEVNTMAGLLQQRDRALREERDRAQAYLDLVGVMVVALNSRGEIILANKRASDLLGCPPEAPCLGSDWFERFIPAESRVDMRRIFDDLMLGSLALHDYHENEVSTCGGERRLIAWHNAPLRDADGRIVGTLSAGEDITEARRMQTELLASQNAFRTLVANVPGAVYRCEVDFPWRVDFMSDSVEAITGVPAARFLDGSVRYGELIHPDDLPAVNQAIAGAISARQPFRCTYRVRHTDGGWRRALEHGRTLHDAGGKPVRLEGVILDISDLDKAEQALRASEERLRLAQEIAHIGSFEWNVNTGANLWTPELEALYGLPPGGFSGNQEAWERLVHPDDLDAAQERVRHTLSTGEPVEGEWRVIWPDGTVHWLAARWQAFLDGAGLPERMAGINIDITERKRLQAEQDRLRLQLQQTQKMEVLGQLTGGIAHDFNNILASMLGFARLALRRHTGPDTPELGEYLHEILDSGERARELVAKMLTFARVQPGRVSVPTAPAPLAREVLKMLKATIPSSVRIDMHVDDDLPDIAIDAVDFHQILVNLVVNARDAVGEKGHIAVALLSRRVDRLECTACHRLFAGEYVELVVTDEGEGIAPDILPRIFEPFFTTKDIGKGTGMGLAVVHGLVSRSGGHFLVEPREGGGTVFRVFLPLATDTEAAACLPVTATGVPALPPGHAMVIDDEAAIVRLLRAALRDAGWRVSAYESPAEALAAFRTDPDRFDVVVTDQTMPGITGVELTSAVHIVRPDLPVILCTGYSENLSDEQARNWGVSRYLRKPVDTDLLIALMNEVRAEARM